MISNYFRVSPTAANNITSSDINNLVSSLLWVANLTDDFLGGSTTCYPLHPPGNTFYDGPTVYEQFRLSCFLDHIYRCCTWVRSGNLCDDHNDACSGGTLTDIKTLLTNARSTLTVLEQTHTSPADKNQHHVEADCPRAWVEQPDEDLRQSQQTK